MAGERTNYLSWDEYFMSIVALSSLRSINRASGVCLVDENHRILSVGYEDIPYNIKQNDQDRRFVVSSLSQALYTFKGRRQEFKNSTLYLSHFPNYEESKQIVQAKVKKIIYLIKGEEKEEEISNIILSYGNVEIIPYYDSLYSKESYLDFLNKLNKVIKSNIGKDMTFYLSSDEYFMGVASLSALRSKDPSTQVGACLVDKKNRILSIGYNGSPYGMSDELLPWHSLGEETGDLFKIKDSYVVHAEMNAFDNYRGNQDDLQNSKLYLTYSPCMNCTKRISIADLERVVYLREYKKNGISKISNKWLNKSQTICESYYDDRDYSKEECLKFFDETTDVVKTYLKKR